MRKVLLITLCLSILSIPAICSATPPSPGPYFSGFLGVVFPSDVDSTGFNLQDRVEFDPGFGMGGTAGFDFGAMRIEAELSYKEQEIKTVTDRISNDRYTGVDGSVDATAFMLNVFVDLHNPGPVTPYFGAGVGFATLHQSDTYGTSTASGEREWLYLSDEDSVAAFQLGAGVEIALNRLLSLDLGYRYFRTSEASFVENDMEFENHNASVGLRVKY